MHNEGSHLPISSIIIPAHNEERSLDRLLNQLLRGATPGELEIVVVCNGCTDATADVARQFGRDVRTIETPNQSKRDALKLGNAEASAVPRIYLDADVEISYKDVRRLLTVFEDPRLLAAAPRRVVRREDVGLLVRAYYDVWERLPQVSTGLFARGLIAVSAVGYERIRHLPPVMSDDLAISEAFGPGERTIVECTSVTVRPPRTIRDLLRRRVRVYTGNAQLDEMEARTSQVKTSVGDLRAIVRADHRMILRMPVFIAVSVVARTAALRRIRKRDFTTWLRDESSRAD